MIASRRFSMKKVYTALIEDDAKVPWRCLFQHNPARPWALFTLWMLCHGRLPTKDRLIRFGLITESICSICKSETETMSHIFFNCSNTSHIWIQILKWIEVDHHPLDLQNELRWIIEETKKKGWKAKILKLAFAESIYGIWGLRNEAVFGTSDFSSNVDIIIDSIIYRGWNLKAIRHHIARLMV
ncbi:uncharacterized protein LOC131606065 [Vicia villosa]|uniref:uncharacterized protein LOC131606065 n=1 Tax=Vicia villosa TaxID=3911 RepID=UPI00273B2B0E|nr:uncharacterized protein LOC131606065 [Vicia villosa]